MKRDRSPAGHADAPRSRTAGSTLALELTTAGLTLGAIFGFRRVFADWSFLLPMMACGVGVHLTCRVTRLLGVRTPIALMVNLLVAIEVWMLVFYARTTWFGVPTTATRRDFAAEVNQAFGRFRSVVAPVVPLPGFVAVAAIGILVLAWFIDGATFRARAPVQACVASGALFLTTSVFARQQHRVWPGLVFVGACGAYLLAFRVHTAAALRWHKSAGRSGAAALARMGCVALGVALVGSGLVADRVPGASLKPVFDLRRLGQVDRRTVPSPFVAIDQQLTDQSSDVMFTATSPSPTYWRLTSLDRFENGQWTMSATPSGTRGGDDAAEGATSSVTISSLGGVFVPVPWKPLRIRGLKDVGWDTRSGSVLRTGKAELQQSERYEVVSSTEGYSAAAARANREKAPEFLKDADSFKRLPAGFSPSTIATARETIDLRNNDLGRALQLQRFFDEGGFTYDADVNFNGEADPFEAFLLARRGFCQQYASTFAVMARAVGLPARVAVGFTWGEPEQDRPGTYVVRGRHAHAWPEVYIMGLGWTPFEPTPGRGNPQATQLTGRPPAQAFPDPGDSTDEPTPEPNGSGSNSPTTTLAPAPADGNRPEVATGADTGTTGPANPTGLPRPLLWTLLVLSGAGIIVAVRPAWVALRRRRRSDRARTPDEQVGLAWTETCDRARRAGVGVSPADTPTETARRAIRVLEPTAVEELAALETVRRFAPEGAGHHDGESAMALAGRVHRGWWQSLARRDRVRWWFGLGPAARSVDDPDVPKRRRWSVPGRFRRPTNGR